jgi:hypothetical protein
MTVSNNFRYTHKTEKVHLECDNCGMRFISSIGYLFFVAGLDLGKL